MRSYSTKGPASLVIGAGAEGEEADEEGAGAGWQRQRVQRLR